MISMQGVPSSLIAKNESWVRKQAQTLARHLPSNVEKADLIQVGLIAVAQASLSFVWEGDRDTPEATEAFLRYARARVKGAMLDELRQMDHLGRGQRRKIKALQIARERLRGAQGSEPSMAQLAELCDMSIDEMSKLEQADLEGRAKSNPVDDSGDEQLAEYRAATPHDEVEARVDTGIVMRRLERFFAALPERERQVIDAYMGIGLTPTQLAAELKVTPSRVSQMFKALVQRTALHFGQDPKRALDRLPERSPDDFDRRIAQRELELAARIDEGAWGHMMESALTRPITPPKPASRRPGAATSSTVPQGGQRIRVDGDTRWG
ncbi:MAG: sigma-70 family RNA polymerase sigma factor [Burkholderiaceae bacterium]|nr:sigma-70 family RNA polymerase sigma factor [Burkholderiaceae bacterium]